METCKANKCIKVSGVVYKGKQINGWYGFERCSKKVYKDGFCKRCYEPDKRFKSPHVWIPDQLWKRDGIYGEPYDFPYHIKESDKKWVEIMYTLYPNLKPKQKNITSDDKIEKIKFWLKENEDNISYGAGIKLNEILNN
tara:strand:+ start:121 stop:537 length:417 start_codon:yes stop_codon:yes gene_type:complete